MPTPPRTDEKCRVALEAYKAHDYNYTNAAKALDWSVSTLKNCVTDAIRRGIDPSIVGAAPLGHHVHGVSTLYDADGKPITQWVKTRYHSSPEDIAETLVAALADIKGYAKLPPAPKKTDSDLATLIALADLHVGLLAWKGETSSQEDWDTETAFDRLKALVAELMLSTPPAQLGVVLSLGDLTHFDGYEPITSRSRNVLDTDSRYPKVLGLSLKLMVYVTDLALQKYQEVLVRILPGNHDDQTAIAIALALAAWYRNDPRVTVDTDGSRWWFWRWGKTFIGATHGDMAKMADIAKTMAAARPEDWGASKFRYGLSGHIHRRSKAADDIMSVQVESFATPIPRDFWADSMGYTPQRNLNAITYSKERGEVSRNRVSL